MANIKRKTIIEKDNLVIQHGSEIWAIVLRTDTGTGTGLVLKTTVKLDNLNPKYKQLIFVGKTRAEKYAERLGEYFDTDLFYVKRVL